VKQLKPTSGFLDQFFIYPPHVFTVKNFSGSFVSECDYHFMGTLISKVYLKGWQILPVKDMPSYFTNQKKNQWGIYFPIRCE
jgi:hypothetical protein